MDSPNGILQKASYYVADLFRDKLPYYYVYHNYQHTQDTVATCIELAGYYQEISKDVLEQLTP